VKISGKITYDDGSLIQGKRILIQFNPQAEPIDKKTFPRRGSADVKTADGTFAEATTIEFGDGVVLGKHKVEAWIVDEKRSKTPLTITPNEVEAGKGSTHFEFKAKKPK
jgi:hypothetical protein